MPEHLEKVAVRKEAEDMILNLGSWLADNGEYRPASRRSFDECVSRGLENIIIPFGIEVAKGIATGPIRCGVARPGDPIYGGWLTGELEQLLICARVLEGSMPYISDGKTSLLFPRGTVVYRAPKNSAFISSGVEFAYIHWPAK